MHPFPKCLDVINNILLDEESSKLITYFPPIGQHRFKHARMGLNAQTEKIRWTRLAKGPLVVVGSSLKNGAEVLWIAMEGVSRRMAFGDCHHIMRDVCRGRCMYNLTLFNFLPLTLTAFITKS